MKFQAVSNKMQRMDAVKEDMQVVGVRVEDTKNRLKWKTVMKIQLDTTDL